MGREVAEQPKPRHDPAAPLNATSTRPGCGNQRLKTPCSFMARRAGSLGAMPVWAILLVVFGVVVAFMAYQYAVGLTGAATSRTIAYVENAALIETASGDNKALLTGTLKVDNNPAVVALNATVYVPGVGPVEGYVAFTREVAAGQSIVFEITIPIDLTPGAKYYVEVYATNTQGDVIKVFAGDLFVKGGR